MPGGEDRPKSVEELDEQLRVKDAIVNGISDALMLLDAKMYEILEVNKAFLAFYGLRRGDVIGKKCHEITHNLDRPCHQINALCPCPLEDTVATGTLSFVEHIHQGKDGQSLYFEISAYPLIDADGRISRIIHLSRDITQRKHLEFQLREKEKLNGILEIAGGASHEINQPLTVIISGLEQLLKRVRQGDPEYELTQTILNHARRLSEVSQKLVQITRYASKEYVAGKRIIDLDQASGGESES